MYTLDEVTKIGMLNWLLQSLKMIGLVLLTFLIGVSSDLFDDASDNNGDNEQQFSMDTIGADIDLAQCQLRCLLSANINPVSFCAL